MPIKGSWLAQQEGYVAYDTSLKQGTGINPVHNTFGGPGRNTAPGTPGEAPPETLVDQEIYDDYGYCEEDHTNVLFGYGTQTGLADRPRWGESDMGSDVLPGYPHPGYYEAGIPGGTAIRSVEHGAKLTGWSKVEPDEDALQGWVNKETSFVNDAEVSDPVQLVMQTSMLQRDKVRAGSQSSGTASEYNAPIKQHIPGMIKRVYSGQQRHDDMQPKEQNVIIRPFWNRTMGTGNPAAMQVNELYQSEPYLRTPPQDAPQGATAGDVQPSADGYTSEDVFY